MTLSPTFSFKLIVEYPPHCGAKHEATLDSRFKFWRERMTADITDDQIIWFTIGETFADLWMNLVNRPKIINEDGTQHDPICFHFFKNSKEITRINLQ